MAKEINVEIKGNTAGFIGSINSAEAALARAVAAMKANISSLNTSVGSLNATFAGVTASTRAFMASTGGMGASTGASGAQITALNATLTTLIQRLANNTSALINSSVAMGHLTTSTTGATTAMAALAGAAGAAGAGVGGAGAGAGAAAGRFGGLTGSLMSAAKGFAALYAAKEALDLFKESKEAVVEAEAAFKGFESAVNATGTNMNALNPIIEKYAKNTAMTRAEIMQSMSSMMKMKFTPEQMDKALGSATDLAAFGKQKGKKYGQAIVEGFEGLRMGISNNTNNMGWQENIAKAEENYAAKIGKTVDQLDQKEKAEAYVISMAKEGAYASGDAAKAQESLAGSIDAANKRMQESKEYIGQALIPAYELLGNAQASVYEGIAFMVKTIMYFGKSMQSLTVDIIGYFEKAGIAIDALMSGSMKGVTAKLDAVDKRIKDQQLMIAQQQQKIIDGKGYEGELKTGGKKVDDTKEETPKEKYEKAKEAYDLMMAKSDAELATKKANYEKDLTALKQQLKDKLISLQDFHREADKLTNSMGSNIQSYLDNKLVGLKTLLGYGPKDNQTQVAIIKTEGEKQTEAAKTQKQLTTNRGLGGGGGSSGGNSPSDIAKAQHEYEKQLRENDLELLKSINQSQINLSTYKFNAFKTSAEEYYTEVKKLENEEFALRQNNLQKDKAELALNLSKAKNKSDELRLKKEISAIDGQLYLNIMAHNEKQSEANRLLETYNNNLKKTRDMNAMSNKKDDMYKDIQLAQINAEKDRAMGVKKSGGPGSEIDGQIEVEKAKYQVAVDYINEKKKYLLANEKENQQELIALDQELYSLQRDNIIALATLEKDKVVAKQQGYLQSMETYKTAGANFIASTAKDASSIKKNWLSLGDSIENQLMEIASKNLMEKIFNIDAVDKFMNAFASNSTGAGTGMSILSSAGSSLSSGFSSLFSGGGSMISSIGSSIASVIPWMDTGTNYVPKDTLAVVHEGEAVVPKRYNNAQNQGGQRINLTNNFISNAVPDKRTQHQMALSAGNSVKASSARR